MSNGNMEKYLLLDMAALLVTDAPQQPPGLDNETPGLFKNWVT